MLLPKQLLQTKLRVQLYYKDDLSLEKLAQACPIAYYALANYWLEPASEESNQDSLHLLALASLQTISASGIINLIPITNILHETLILSNHKTVAEVITLLKQPLLFLVYLRLLPAEFGLFAPLHSSPAMNFYAKLLKLTINKLTRYASQNGCRQIITDVYNPNVQQLLHITGFKTTKANSQVQAVIHTTRMQLDM